MQSRSNFKLAAAVALVLATSYATRKYVMAFGGGFGPGAAMPAPEELAAFRTDYAIPAGETVNRIEPPFPASRRAGYISLDPAARMSGGSSSGWPLIPKGMIIQWTDAGPVMKDKTQYADPGYTVLHLLRGILDPSLAHPKADRATLWTDLPGDFVLKAGATQDQILPPLAKILSAALGRQVTLQVRTEPTDVYILSGQFKFTPIDDATWNQRFANSSIGPQPRPNEAAPHLYIYSTDLGPQQVRPDAPHTESRMLDTSARDQQALVDAVTERINAPFIIDAQDWPRNFAYMDHGNPIPPGADAEATNTRLILDHLAAQTGLTWKKETRDLKHVVVEDVKKDQ